MQKEKGKKKGDVCSFLMIGLSLASTYLFISPMVDPSSLLREALPGMFFITSIMGLITFLFLYNIPIFRPHGGIQKGQRGERVGGMLFYTGLMILALAELLFPENVFAQLVGCGISIGFSLMARKVFSQMQPAGTLAPNKNPDGAL